MSDPDAPRLWRPGDDPVDGCTVEGAEMLVHGLAEGHSPQGILTLLSMMLAVVLIDAPPSVGAEKIIQGQSTYLRHMMRFVRQHRELRQAVPAGSA